MASATRRAKRAAKHNNMSENPTTELNFGDIINNLNNAVQNLDKFAQAATADSEDQVLRARLTQALVLAGTSIEILGGLNAQAKAAEAAQAVSQNGEDTNV